MGSIPSGRLLTIKSPNWSGQFKFKKTPGLRVRIADCQLLLLELLWSAPARDLAIVKEGFGNGRRTR
jgi:hypothetical protein